jgi:hypothetical protein
VQLVGFCSETNKKLVQLDGRYIQADITESLLCYEYLPAGSLQDNLFGTRDSLALLHCAELHDPSTSFFLLMYVCSS